MFKRTLFAFLSFRVGSLPLLLSFDLFLVSSIFILLSLLFERLTRVSTTSIVSLLSHSNSFPDILNEPDFLSPFSYPFFTCL